MVRYNNKNILLFTPKTKNNKIFKKKVGVYSKKNMNIEEININQIKPAKYNPRKITDNELNKLKKSIQEYGLVDPLIINLNNMTIISGHQRYKILQEENNKTGKYETLQLYKMGDVGWVFTDETLTIPTESYEKGLNIALNKISGEWDYTKLNKLMDELLEDKTFNINLTGFNDLDMESLNKNLEDLEFEQNNPNNMILSMVIDCQDETELNQLYSRLDEEGYDIKVR